jgi:hypothetical protein
MRHSCFVLLSLLCVLFRTSFALQKMSQHVYYCDCAVRCKREKQVSRATYFKHAQFRHVLPMDLDTFTAARAGNATTFDNETNIGTSSLHGTHNSVGQSKRRRLDGEDIEQNEENRPDGVNELTATVSNTSFLYLAAGWDNFNISNGLRRAHLCAI